MIALMNQPTKAVKTETPHQTKKSATVKNLPNDRPRAVSVVKKEAPQRQLPILPGSMIAFFINGKCQGVAFRDIYDYLQLRPTPNNKERPRKNKDDSREHKQNPFDDGSLGYYPFFSLFGGAQIYMNPGPDFEFPPPTDIDSLLTATPSTTQTRTWRPMSERYAEFMKQEWDLDEKEAAEKAKEDARRAAKEMAKEAAREAREAAKKGPEAQAPEGAPALDPDVQEKKRAQKERKQKTEAARRKRKAEEKRAAVAAATGGAIPLSDLAPLGEAGRFIFMDGSRTSSAAPSSPAPSVAVSVAPSAAVDMDIDEALVAAVTNGPTRTPTPNLHVMKDEHYERGSSIGVQHMTSGAPSPQMSDVFGRVQQDDWQSEGQSEYEREQEPDSEGNQQIE
jgi:COMPASS component BRE2